VSIKDSWDIPLQTGSLLIAPTAFTHTHRGHMPKGGDKYIATSWVLFRRRAAAG